MNGNQELDMALAAGNVALYPAGARLQFRVRIVGKRRVYGRLEVKIVPEAGEGSQWVTLKAVELVQAQGDIVALKCSHCGHVWSWPRNSLTRNDPSCPKCDHDHCCQITP